MKQKIIIFSDVDGTLYDKNFIPREDTIRDISFALSLGGKFVIATGNPPFERHQELAKKVGSRYLITSNGATIFDNQEKKYIFSNEFDLNLQQKIIDLSLKYNSQLNFWNKEQYFSLNPKIEFENSYYYSLYEPEKQVLISSSPANGVVKMELFDNEENIAKIYQEIKDWNLEIVYMRKEHLELTIKNSSKGNAMKWLINHLQGDIENVMAIGDSPNDWSMLSIAGYSYAMANASQETKKQAKFHTAACDQNGLGMAIIDYLHRIKADR